MLERIGAISALGLLLLTGLSAGAAAQQAAALRVGYTDHEVLISNMPEYQDIQKRLQTEYQSSQKVLQAMYEDFQGKVERYQEEQAQLSEEQRTERESELAKAQQEIQRKATDSEQELARREVDLLDPIFKRVDTAIKSVAAANNIDLVLRTQAGRTQPIILYANEDRIMDITREVAQELGIDVGEGTASEK